MNERIDAIFQQVLNEDCAEPLYRFAELVRQDERKQAEKQEPFGYFQLDLRMDAWVQNRDNKKGVPFYTAPPKREWVGLTDQEVAGYSDMFNGIRLIKAIEALLRERNK
jgi:hypothetical protein